MNYNNHNGIYLAGSLICAQTLFSLRALYGVMQIYSYERISSLIRTWQSDSFVMRSRHFSGRKPLGTAVPYEENLPTCALSGHEPPTYHILGR